jgi:ABC-type glutathione transport system ATPase component
MWPSERARGAAIQRLLAPHHGLAGLWTPAGPTDFAVELLEAGGGHLSGGERVLLRAAFDLWNGAGHVTVDELLSTLDATNLRAVCAAMLARDAGAPPHLEVVHAG